MTCKIYLPQDWMYGDATSFYVDILADAMKNKGYEVSKIKDIGTITTEDVVITVASYNVKEVKTRNPQKIINWYQGVGAEEYFLFLSKKANDSILKRVRNFISLSKADAYALKHCDYNFFVSDTMRKYYKKKHLYTKENYFLMPCFNQILNPEAFKDCKYNTPSFVYAGSLDGWQCFEKTVKLYSEIKKIIPAATFTVMTASQDEARKILDQYGVSAEVKYVSYDKVDEELRKYKYGFIIREDNIVNNVATPTKMNSYLANGIIPIYTNVVGAFKDNIGNLRYSVPLTTKNVGLDKLYDIEKLKISKNDVFTEYEKLFNLYYNRDYYVEVIAKLSF